MNGYLSHYPNISPVGAPPHVGPITTCRPACPPPVVGCGCGCGIGVGIIAIAILILIALGVIF